MRVFFALLLLCCLGIRAAVASDARVLSGILKTPNGDLHVNISVSQDANGVQSSTLAIAEQGNRAMACDETVWTDSKFHIAIKAYGVSVDGTPSADGKTVEAKFRQGAFEAAITLTTGAAKLTINRPQTPKPPFPYAIEDLVFHDVKAGVDLSGTFTCPTSGKILAAVVLVCGSGRQDRDEQILSHRPFWVIADYLSRCGIAVLRYDKRGVGKSTGAYALAGIPDFAADASSAVDALSVRSELKGVPIGIIGHSEGGAVAPIVANRTPRVKFIVMLAGPGIRGDKLLVRQVEMLSLAQGAPPSAIAADLHARQVLYETLLTENNPERQQQAVDKALLVLAPGADKQQAAAASKSLLSPALLSLMRYDPAIELRKVKVPVLALDGTLDLQVEGSTNLVGIKEAVLAGGNKRVEVVNFPGLNHLFQPAKLGLVSEYFTIETTIAPEVLKKLGEWIPANARN